MGEKQTLEEARKLRASLKLAMSELEIAAASPARAPGWRDEVRGRLGALRTALGQHTAAVEAPGALLDEIVEESPRLTAAVEAIRQEHVHLDEKLQALDSELAMPPSEPGAGAGEIRETVLSLLHDVAQHRNHGSDLVYDAFAIDIGRGG